MTPTHLGTFQSINHPCRIQSDDRAATWRDFAVLLVFGNVGFWVWIIWGAF